MRGGGDLDMSVGWGLGVVGGGFLGGVKDSWSYFSTSLPRHRGVKKVFICGIEGVGVGSGRVGREGCEFGRVACLIKGCQRKLRCLGWN